MTIAVEATERVASASRADGASALERARSALAGSAVSYQQVAGYEWRLSPDGKALFLTRPTPPERPDRQIAPFMLRDVEQVLYRDKADLTPERAEDAGTAAPRRVPESTAPASAPSASVAPVSSAPAPAPTPQPTAEPAPTPPEPPPALRFREADASS